VRIFTAVSPAPTFSAPPRAGAPRRFDLLLLAEADLGRDVGPRHRQGAGFAAAAVVEVDALAHQGIRHLDSGMVLHRRVAGLVVHVLRALDAVEPDALLVQPFVDIHQPAAGEDLAEFVLQQLVHAGAAGHHHGLDVEVVQRVGDAVEQHAVGGGDGLALVLVARRRSADSRSTGSPAAAPWWRRRARAWPGWRGRLARTGAPSRSRGSRTPLPHPRRPAAGRGSPGSGCRPRCRAGRARCASARSSASAC
jgi:hypothetical protein